ncbi:MAG TPA: hypothetical protein VN414_12445 [Methanosarcina sp.]|nr:hypothetical protein [Methanosarcina sp.]
MKTVIINEPTFHLLRNCRKYYLSVFLFSPPNFIMGLAVVAPAASHMTRAKIYESSLTVHCFEDTFKVLQNAGL